MAAERQVPGGPPAGSTDAERAVFWRNRTLMLFDHVPLLTAFCDAEGTVIRANTELALEWGMLPGRMVGRSVLELFRPRSPARLERILDAIRQGRRSRHRLAVSWEPAAGGERRGEMTVDLIGDADEPLHLLLLLRRRDAAPSPAPSAPAEEASPTETRILALAASGATTAQIARAVGLTPDGVAYHVTQLCRRWETPNRTALVARAYTLGVLDATRWPP